jgi:hypothetical protein
MYWTSDDVGRAEYGSGVKYPEGKEKPGMKYGTRSCASFCG